MINFMFILEKKNHPGKAFYREEIFYRLIESF